MPRTIEAIEIQVVPDESPDISWLDQTDAQMGEGFEAFAAKRKAQIQSGDVGIVGVRVAAKIRIRANGPGFTTMDDYVVTSPGVWGIESDSGEDYFRTVAADELGMLDELLRADGFTPGEITKGLGSSLPIPITYTY